MSYQLYKLQRKAKLASRVEQNCCETFMGEMQNVNEQIFNVQHKMSSITPRQKRRSVSNAQARPSSTQWKNLQEVRTVYKHKRKNSEDFSRQRQLDEQMDQIQKIDSISEKWNQLKEEISVVYDEQTAPVLIPSDNEQHNESVDMGNVSDDSNYDEDIDELNNTIKLRTNKISNIKIHSKLQSKGLPKQQKSQFKNFSICYHPSPEIKQTKMTNSRAAVNLMVTPRIQSHHPQSLIGEIEPVPEIYESVSLMVTCKDQQGRPQEKKQVENEQIYDQNNISDELNEKEIQFNTVQNVKQSDVHSTSYYQIQEEKRSEQKFLEFSAFEGSKKCSPSWRYKQWNQ